MEKKIRPIKKIEFPKKLSNTARTLAAADRGNVLSMCRLGKHYLRFDIREEGHNYEESVQAMYWLSKAAQENLWEAYYWLSYEVELFRKSMGFGGEKYFLQYRDRAMQTNPIYLDILRRLERDGYTKETRGTIKRDNYDKINAAYLFFYSFNLLYYRGYPYQCDDITSSYLTKAAEHGCVEAQRALALGYKESWDDWCDKLLRLEPTRAAEYLKDDGISVAEIKGFYQSAKNWLLKASLAGDEVDKELIDLLESRKKLDKFEERANE